MVIDEFETLDSLRMIVRVCGQIEITFPIPEKKEYERKRNAVRNMQMGLWLCNIKGIMI